jgi:mannose-6-phosphate isomerase-like protein (cupin superfamily)
MAGYTIKRLEEVPDIFGGQYPGIMRMLSEPLETEQVAITHRQMTPGSGGKGGYGHRHKTQEEIYFVVSGKLEFKLDDEVLELEGGSAVRVAPEVVRSVWNEGPEDAELIIVSTRIANPRDDAEMIEDFWPA